MCKDLVISLSSPLLSLPLLPLSLSSSLQRASDPEEIYKIHERKQQLQKAQERESQLDQLISICKQELSLLSENQENWQYLPYFCLYLKII